VVVLGLLVLFVEDSVLSVVVVAAEVVVEVAVGEVVELLVELLVWVDSGITVNAVTAVSLAGLPLEVITYAPTATFATMKVAFSTPPEIEQLALLTGSPESEHVTSAGENPEPDT
jgi:hypothetical protein